MPPHARVAVRVVLLDPASSVLLFEGRDLSDASDARRFWFTVGGGVDEGESLAEAAEREVLEETGQSGLTLVGPIHRREFNFLDHGVPRHQVEHFFAARTAATALDVDGWTDLERRAMTAWRWWSVEQLQHEGIEYFPENLIELVRLADAQV